MIPTQASQFLKEYKATEIPNVKVHGRYAPCKDFIPLLFNGSAVEVNCDGSELWVLIDTDCGFHEPWICTELNGALMSRQMLLPGTEAICLFRGMTGGVVKNVRFTRELQAMSEDDKCRILVKGFATDGEFLPVREAKHKIEIIGDSITSGEGTYGTTTDTDWLAMYMSCSRHYGRLLGKMLDAEVRLFSQGGWGVYCGWDNDVRHNIPSVYEKVCGLASGYFNEEELKTQEPYDFSQWQPDAVIVNLGTNDNSAFDQPPLHVPGVGLCKQRRNPDGSYVREDAEKVIAAVIDFLKTLRRVYPKSHIVWTYGMLGYYLTPYLSEAVNTYREETGDSNVMFLNIPDTGAKEYGAHMHPGYVSHEHAAKVLADYLRGRLGEEVRELGGNL